MSDFKNLLLSDRLLPTRQVVWKLSCVHVCSMWTWSLSRFMKHLMNCSMADKAWLMLCWQNKDGVHVCMCVCVYVCLTVCLSVCMSSCLSVCLTVDLSDCLYVYPSVRPSVRPSVCLYWQDKDTMHVCLSNSYLGLSYWFDRTKTEWCLLTIWLEYDRLLATLITWCRYNNILKHIIFFKYLGLSFLKSTNCNWVTLLVIV